MGSIKEQILSGVKRNEDLIELKPTHKPTLKTTQIKLEKLKPQELTPKEEDFILEQAREDYLENKYKEND